MPLGGARIGTQSSPPRPPGRGDPKPPGPVSQQAINARSNALVRDVPTWNSKIGGLDIPAHLVLTDERRAQLRHIFSQQCELSPVSLTVDPNVDIRHVKIADGMGDHANIRAAARIRHDERLWSNHCAAVNANLGYFPQHDNATDGRPGTGKALSQEMGVPMAMGGASLPRGVKRTQTRSNSSEGRDGQGKGQKRSKGPGAGRDGPGKIPLRTGTMPPIPAAAAARIGRHMEALREQRETQTAARVAYDRARAAERPEAHLKELGRAYSRAHTSPVDSLVPNLTRRCLAAMDKGVTGAGYSNTTSDWYKNGNDSKTKAAQKSRQTQHHHAIRLVRRLLLSGAVRGIPGLGILCAWLETMFEGEQVESVDPHYQG